MCIVRGDTEVEAWTGSNVCASVSQSRSVN